MRTEDSKLQKNNRIVVVASIILWFVSLFNGTGIGAVYNVYNRAIGVVTIYFMYEILFNGQFRTIKKSTVLLIFVLIFQNVYTNAAYGKNFFEYLKIYMIPILYSLMTVDKKQMRTIGLVYGAGGGAILVFANFTKYFAGWDGNSVSQICFFSYTVFIASMFDIRKREHQQRIIIYSCFYFILLVTLNSRSCMLFSAFLLLCEIGLIPARRLISKNTLTLWLIVPLFVAIIVISISNAPYMDRWNEWSMKYFHKALTSGREQIWNVGFETWIKHPLFGIGSFGKRWHNSAVACLAGAGIVGYFIWIYLIREILTNACEYLEDNAIFGTVIAFLTVWLQQSFELGIISTRGNPVIFVLLGLILARTNTLKKQEIEGDISDQ